MGLHGGDGGTVRFAHDASGEE
ncbi:hypothetical protein A2U01_0044660 [Trifolium medium]|uniref:Uncharacterized protein n=1 Tax=Trifolium medium TaxID=97028 RepID=A0A392QID5_9FABA|nr:hypothetical protein [Trifolium medium]